MTRDTKTELSGLFRAYYEAVYGFFAKRGFLPQECEDLTQETFLRVYKKWADFRRDASEKTWLFTVAANVYRNALRDRKAGKRDGQELPFDELPPSTIRNDFPRSPPADDPLESVLAAERQEALDTELMRLPPRMRHCVVLRLGQQLTFEEIAGTMRISIETVKSHISQAAKRLHLRLARHFEDFET